MITNAIARRYAKALVQLAAEEGAVERFSTELSAFVKTLADNPDLVSIFGSPAYGTEAKREILKEVISGLSISGTAANFLQLLLDKGRLSLASEIADSYRVFADELSGIIRPTLASGLPLEEKQVEEIRTALEKSTGKKVMIKVEVDPSLIGGVVTKIGDKLFDGSVRTQLNRIEDILQKG